MKKLHSKWQLFLYGMGGMGVNLLNLVIGAYLCDALMVEGFEKDIEYWTYANKTLIVAVVWSVMITVAKIIDGIIDIPLATLSDNLRTRWGRRRPALLAGFIPMVLAFVGFLNPVSVAEHSAANTAWFAIMLCLFYVFYTLTMGTYYATFSEVVDNEKDRVLLSNYKTVFDIIYFLLGYGLIPVLISARINIRIIGYIFLPLALTMLIPVFMIKEGSNRKKDLLEAGKKEEGVSLIKAIKYCMTNKAFVLWMCVYAALQFGLQMFITGENVFYSGAMSFAGLNITIIMAAIFVPVPATLLLYNKVVRKKGLKWGFIYSLSAFALAMLVMGLDNKNIVTNDTLRLVIAVIGGLIASFGIGCFFSISYTVPSHLAAIQKKKTGDSNPTMYFAVQGLFSGIATAISTGVVWVNLKNAGGGVYVWLLPIIVFVMLAVAFGLSFLLPKELNELGMGERATEAIEEAPLSENAEPVAEVIKEPCTENVVPDETEEAEFGETQDGGSAE